MVAMYPDSVSTTDLPSALKESGISPNSTSSGHLYYIEDSRISNNALVLFTRDLLSSHFKPIAMKLLCTYKDSRYNLATLKERQYCQLEALRKNRIFTTDVYIGLAPILKLELEQRWICIGQSVEYPNQDSLDSDTEYALLMHQLPESRRLDILLQEKDEFFLYYYRHILTIQIAHIHTNLISHISKEEIVYWGSYEQLYAKLLHNLALLDLIPTANANARDYSIRNSYMLNWLKETLLKVFSQEQYRTYFEQRVRGHYIKHCHGDMKAANIWILPFDAPAGRCEQYIKILDAIDFNPSYCTIDILSDFAMLAIDIQARTGSASLADETIEEYLTLTDQKDDISKSVLNYYLVEKAISIAAVSIIYDGQLQFGVNLLAVARMRLEHLLSLSRAPNSLNKLSS
jgi:aminoglycoside phosphotransferase family enzyme